MCLVELSSFLPTPVRFCIAQQPSVLCGLCSALEMRGPSASAEDQKPSEAPTQQPAAETHEEAFDEPDDELEEFDEIGGEGSVSYRDL